MDVEMRGQHAHGGPRRGTQVAAQVVLLMVISMGICRGQEQELGSGWPDEPNELSWEHAATCLPCYDDFSRWLERPTANNHVHSRPMRYRTTSLRGLRYRFRENLRRRHGPQVVMEVPADSFKLLIQLDEQLGMFF